MDAFTRYELSLPLRCIEPTDFQAMHAASIIQKRFRRRLTLMTNTKRKKPLTMSFPDAYIERADHSAVRHSPLSVARGNAGI